MKSVEPVVQKILYNIFSIKKFKFLITTDASKINESVQCNINACATLWKYFASQI